MGRKLTLTKARGSLVWDADGNEYIDCTAQAWSNNLGANDPRVLEAAIRQLQDITHVRSPNYHTAPLLELTAKLVELAPGDLTRVGYCLHGSLATEMAIKLAFRNRPGAQNLLVLQDGYHGRSLAGLAASWPHPGNPFGPLQPRFTRVPHPYPYRTRLGLSPEDESQLCLDAAARDDREGRRRTGRGADDGADPGQWRPRRVPRLLVRRRARDLRRARHCPDLGRGADRLRAHRRDVRRRALRRLARHHRVRQGGRRRLPARRDPRPRAPRGLPARRRRVDVRAVPRVAGRGAGDGPGDRA